MSIYQHLDVSQNGDIIVVRFKVHDLLVNGGVVKDIGSELGEVTDRPDCRKLVVDFFGVVNLSSVLLGLMVTLHEKMASKQGQLVLCGLRPAVRELFDQTMLSRLLDIVDIREGEADAFAALASPDGPSGSCRPS